MAKKIARILHLWLGQLSCVVVFVVCVTGCIYAFKDEINDLRQPWRFVAPQDAPVLPPSAILGAADGQAKGRRPSAITYARPKDAVAIDYFSRESGRATVWVDPYSGAHLHTEVSAPGSFDFFRFILDGHRTLWLPRPVGKYVIGWSVVTFLVVLITGIILWWPRKWNSKTRRLAFTVRLRAGRHRLVFDLHNALGGYAFLFLMTACLTGLVWSFTWFGDGIYRATSGGKQPEPYMLPKSDSLNMALAATQEQQHALLDTLYCRLKAAEPQAESFYFALPHAADGVIRVSVVHKFRSYYRTDNLFFDRYNLAPLEGRGPYAGKYTQATGADKLRRMNLEIHDGRILGLPGRILMFCATLIGASLPVTAWILWLRRKRRHLNA